jgi:hypothetical protein
VKTELEVARDAVRAALGDELADALEWAAAAVKHRATLLSAARLAATEGDVCPDCRSRSVHERKCATAAMLHALDPEWSVVEVSSAHSAALNRVSAMGNPLRAMRGPRPPFEGQPGLEAAVRAATTPEEARAIIDEHYRRERLHVDPDRLTYSAPIGLTTPERVMLTMGSIAHAPQSAQPVIHQSTIDPFVSLCGELYSTDGYPPGAPNVTCPACLAGLSLSDGITPPTRPPPAR